MPIRRTLARALGRVGLIAALEASTPKPGILALNYHRIGDSTSAPYDPGVFTARAEEFDVQVAYLKRCYHVATLQEILEFVKSPQKLKRLEVLITFDDGYLDNYQVAVPILKSHGVQATFFLATSLVGTRSIPWWDKIAFIVRSTKVPSIDLTYPAPNSFPLGAFTLDSLVKILKLYKSPSNADPERFLLELSRVCGVPVPQEAPTPLFMSWDQAREMVSGGMAIGSHTHSHSLLAKLEAKDQVFELDYSRQVIAKELGVDVKALAFPVGSPSAFNDITIASAKQTGYEAAFSYYGGLNKADNLNPFNMLREHVVLPQDWFSMRIAVMTRFGVRV